MWDFIEPPKTLIVASLSGAASVLVVPVFFTGARFWAASRALAAVGFFTIVFLFSCGPRCSVFLTKHVDPVKGSWPVWPSRGVADNGTLKHL